jgi:gliding motility-associated-like protein
MKTPGRKILFIFSILSFICICFTHAQTFPVVINEVMVTPAGDASVNSFYNGDTLNGGNPALGAEWIELYNMNPCDTIDIGCFIIGWETSSGTGQNWGSMYFPSIMLIPPLGHILIGGSNVPNADYIMTINNSVHCSSRVWGLTDSAGWVGLYDNTSQPVSMVYWNINGTAADLNTKPEYAYGVNTNPNTCTCCSLGYLLEPKANPESEFAGNVIPNSSLALARKTDGSPDWILSPVGGTPNSCNAGPDSCFFWEIDMSANIPTCVGGNDGFVSVSVEVVGSPQTPYSYSWSSGQTTQNISGLTAGTYTVTVTDKWYCTLVKDTIIDDPIPPVLTIISNSTLLCQGDSLTLFCDLPGTSYSWSGPNGFVSSLANPFVASMQPVNAGIYSVSMTNIEGCLLTDTIQISVSQLPVLNLGHDTTVCTNESLAYNIDNGNSYTYLWYNGSANPVITVYDGNSGSPDSYWIWASATGCKTVTDSVYINIVSCEIKPSNVMTPNGDGKNDFFLISGIDMHPNSKLIIFNRWGRKVFESNNYQNDWDGDNNPDGVYFYILSIPEGISEGREIHGELTILK